MTPRQSGPYKHQHTEQHKTPKTLRRDGLLFDDDPLLKQLEYNHLYNMYYVSKLYCHLITLILI